MPAPRMLDRLRGLAMDAGLRSYQPIEAGSPDQWDRAYRAGDWDRLDTLSESARYSVLAGYVRRLGPARSLLDVGCGAGLLARHLGPGDVERYLGLDPSPAAIARADVLSSATVRFAVAEVPASGDGPFDFVVCNEVLYYLHDPDRRLGEIAQRMVAPAYLLTSVWRHRGDRALEQLVARRYERVDRVELRRGDSRWVVACWQRRP